MLRRFFSVVEEKALIPNFQFGFRNEHSCNLQLLRKVEYILTAWDKRTHAAVFYFDIAKAFDSVWHNGLSWKLIQAGFPAAFCRLVYSYLQERKFCVRVGDCHSAERSVHRGVPQSSVLGPHLFNLHMSDLPDLRHCEYFQYADDTAIVTSARKRNTAALKLQKAIDTVSNWFHRWKLDLNTDKCAVLLYSRRFVQSPTVTITLNNRAIPWVNRYRYLPLVFDQQLSWRFHATQITDKIKMLKGALGCLLRRNSVLSTDNKLLI